MCKESLKQGAIATEPKPDPDVNTDYCKSVPSKLHKLKDIRLI